MAPRGGVLDSSPIPIPPAPEARPNPLKRSASTASLPTPPRTVHKRRGRGHAPVTRRRRPAGHSTAEETDDERRDELSHRRQKRRKLETIEETKETVEEDEDAFWMGPSSSKAEVRKEKVVVEKRTRLVVVASPSTSSKPRTRSESPSKHVVLDRIKAPVSPPPSRRQPALPVTPPRTTRSATRQALLEASGGVARDSPENPFLDTPESLVGASPGPRTPSPTGDLDEKPTITYVFRGKKAEFVNPHYNQSPTARLRSRLPPEHPDFEPDEACPPKLLFPAARRRRKAKEPEPAAKRPRKKPAVKSEWDTTDEEDGEEEEKGPTTPKKKRARTGTGTPDPSRLDQGISVAMGDVDEPLRRALGPSRGRR
ncbi:hypothetical protein GLOTRDRAFT_141515 [Gloeophyllum trabeum ATCC 11539]|uniref:Uncharacterized protein n=1 Tax=Gloeophyllum trabeum (strain ATCC 11539 / FP-39264 / Madison 617) TaxID=670483 RepID=S7RDB5_GLOTA|nr:uncharacterized protein GLOTRDRAFT_141515 [Gloeophyllum trabeum ATCC 11539]EPQ50419.1 hypothetical protein GLOTRDRAFT_141515 [Gloeophyllum trabeum ATCC 11539]